jgi:hypothetical protein
MVTLIPSRKIMLSKMVITLMLTLEGKKFNQALFKKYAIGTAMITDMLIR